MGTQATIRFDLVANTAQMGPGLAAGEQRLRQFGQNARAAVRGGAGGGGGMAGDLGLRSGLGRVAGMIGGGAGGGGGGMAGDLGLRSGLGQVAGMIGGGAGELLSIASSGIAAPIAGAVGAFALSQKFAGEARAIHQQSQALGVSVETYQEYGVAAQRAGVDTGTFTAAIERLRNKAAEAINGDQGARGLFRSLGIDVGKLESMGTEEILQQTAKGIDKLGGVSRARAEISAFGRAGAQLDPVLRQVAKGVDATVLSFRDIKELESQKVSFQALGTGFAKVWAENGDMFGDWARGLRGFFHGEGFWSRIRTHDAEVAAEEEKEKEMLAKHDWQEAGAQRIPALMSAREKYAQESETIDKIAANQGFDPSDPQRNAQLQWRAIAGATRSLQAAKAQYQTPSQRLRAALEDIGLSYRGGELNQEQAARAAILAEQEAAASQMPSGQAGAFDVDSAEAYAAVSGAQNQRQFAQIAHAGPWGFLQSLLPPEVAGLLGMNRGFQRQPIAFDGRQ
jgi:hypothetical protein